MASGRRATSEIPRGMSYKTVGLAFGSVAVGSMLTVVFLRAVAGGTESISFIGLFGFLFMVVLATVAITLSVVSISLSRKVERRLLRDGELTDSPVVISRPERPVLSVASPSESSRFSAPGVELADKKYSDFRNIVLLGISNYPGVSPLKVGEGHYCTVADDLVDGLFLINREQVAVCVFSNNDLLHERFFGKKDEKFFDFLRALVKEFKIGNFHRVFLVFDGLLGNDNPYAKALNDFSGRVDASVFSRFELFEGSSEMVIPELTERVSQLMVKGGGETVD